MGLVIVVEASTSLRLRLNKNVSGNPRWGTHEA